jgi:hypothetical protein
MLARSAFRPKRQNSHRADEVKRVPGYLQWLRGRPCAIGGQCAGRSEAAHVDYAGDKGMGTKPSDRYAYPSCSAHHGECHNSGVLTFEARHKVNLLKLANEYWAHWLTKTPMGRNWAEKQDG